MDQNALNLLVAAVLPLLISVVKRFNAPQYVNALIAVVVYVIAGIAAVAISGQAFDLNNIVPSVALFTAGGTVAYQLFWKNWGDPQINEATG